MMSKIKIKNKMCIGRKILIPAIAGIHIKETILAISSPTSDVVDVPPIS
jgi:hypothetical protein